MCSLEAEHERAVLKICLTKLNWASPASPERVLWRIKWINFPAKQNKNTKQNSAPRRRRAHACVCVDYMLNLVIGVCVCARRGGALRYHPAARAHLIKHPRVLRRASKLAARRGLIADMDARTSYLSQTHVSIQLWDAARITACSAVGRN